jgi:hypothetical protein
MKQRKVSQTASVKSDNNVKNEKLREVCDPHTRYLH